MVSEAQLDDGYKCSCGWVTLDKKEFTAHLRRRSLEEGKGTHTSDGRVDMKTGEITMPPWAKRTKDQKSGTIHAKRKKEDAKDTVIPSRSTEIISKALEVRFVPRIFTTAYTPIMQQAQDAAVKFFGWPSDMPFEDFLDTVLFFYFKEHGIELGGYTVSEELIRQAQIIASSGDGHGNNGHDPLEEDIDGSESEYQPAS